MDLVEKRTFSTVLIVTHLLFLSNGQIYTDDIITTLTKRLDEQQRQIYDQQSKTDAQQSQIDTQHQRTNMQQQRIDAQRRKIGILETVVKEQQTEIQRLTQMLKDVNNSLKVKANELNQGDNVPNVRSKRQLPNQGTVAFTAVLTHLLNNLRDNQNIVFDSVYTNAGNGYNEHDGVFTAPVSGVYAFHTTIYTLPNRLAYCGIVVNGVSKADVYVQGSTVNNAGSQMIVVELSKGDEVAVQNKNQVDYIYSDRNIFTSFAGFLVQDLPFSNGNVVG